MSPIASPKPAPKERTPNARSLDERTSSGTDGGGSRWHSLGHGVKVRRAAWTPDAQAILTPETVALVAAIDRQLGPARRDLLAARSERQARFDLGELPSAPRHDDAAKAGWRVAAIPNDLRRRRVEITGPVNHRRMVINMLSRNATGARADTAMLDFEDSMKPSWRNVVDGVHNVVGAAAGTLRATKPGRDGAPEKIYRLDPDDMALPMVRVRGLHLDESNVHLDGRPVSAGLLDFVLCFALSADILIRRGITPTYYVPKVEHHLEARWWNTLFRETQKRLGLPVGTLRATFLIETLPAAFDLEGILFEIREHAAGLNVGRWDKIFSDIKVLMKHPDRIMADRATIGMNRPWMRAYAETLIDVCHRRGAMAIGGMAAFTPGREPDVRAEQTAKVLADKRLESTLGHDGCWVSHPYFIDTALEAFPRENQLDRRIDTVPPASALLPEGGAPRTDEGLRTNLRVAIAYLEGWNRDVGCVAWDGLMEDLATLEISRTQVWQWLHHGVATDDGALVDAARVARTLDEELGRIEEELEGTIDEPGARAAAIARFRRARIDAEALFAGADDPDTAFEPFLSQASDPAEDDCRERSPRTIAESPDRS